MIDNGAGFSAEELGSISCSAEGHLRPLQALGIVSRLSIVSCSKARAETIMREFEVQIILHARILLTVLVWGFRSCQAGAKAARKGNEPDSIRSLLTVHILQLI